MRLMFCFVASIFIYGFTPLSAQSVIEPVEVVDLTLKIGGLSSEELFYGFAEGDVIVFSFEEIKGKELKEVEIIELPSQSKFMDFKPTKISEKEIKVQRTGIYQFKFTNSAVSGRICKVIIQRIPISEELINFDTGWEWKTNYDTSYVEYTEDSIIGYDTTYTSFKVKELVKVDTTFDKKEEIPRVHTRLNVNGDKTYVYYAFPNNIENTLYTRKVVAWGYYIGTDKKEPVVSNVSSKMMKSVFALNPVGGMALGVLSIASSTNGNNLDYHIVRDKENLEAFFAERQFNRLAGADVSMAASRFEGNWQGVIYVCLDNDHTYPVDVRVIVSSVMVNYYYEMKEYKKPKLTPVYTTLNKRKMNINSSKCRVNLGS